MDFRAVGLDRLVGSDTINSSSSGLASLASSNPETKPKEHGSRFPKQERPANSGVDWSSSNLSKTESMLLPPRSSTFFNSNATLLADAKRQKQMLSFACHEPALSVESSTHSASFPYFHLPSSAFTNNTGFNSGSFNGPSTRGPLSESKGPFTPSQRMELEHQALIYKHIKADVPIPSNLLIPIRKALDSAGFSSFSGGLLRPCSTLSWGTCYFGFSGNTDSEPGRCRRTDGKKWRCSREAVPDQKYCERHINRGRHRSRKPVEGQSGHSAARNSAKPTPLASVVGSFGGGTPNSLIIAQQQQQQQQLGNFLPVDSSNNPSSADSLGRMFTSKEIVSERSLDSPCLSMLSSDIDLKSKENPFLIPKQHNFYQESSKTEFGLVTLDALLNPSQRCSSLVSSTNFCSSPDLPDPESVSQQCFGRFTDRWSKSTSDRSALSWSALDVQSDGTQLSISTPVAPTDFMSSTSSPNNEHATLSPNNEFDPMQMGLGVGSGMHEHNHRQANWVPISWETSMGGPLGEVLHNTNNGTGESENSSAFSLMTEGRDHCPRLGSSPTGVLQKTVFVSLSSSSTGSSPRAESSKTREGASLSLSNYPLGSTSQHSAS